jgi:hypothetical protein
VISRPQTSLPGIRCVVRQRRPINGGTTSNGVDVYLFATVLDPKTQDISIAQNLFPVARKRNIKTHESTDHHHREYFSSSFRRVVPLPEDMDPKSIDVHYLDELLLCLSGSVRSEEREGPCTPICARRSSCNFALSRELDTTVNELVETIF